MKIIFISLLLIITSCISEKNKINKDNSQYTINIKDAKVSDETVLLSEVIDSNSIELIPLETNDSCLLGSIRRIRKLEDYFYVLDFASSRKLLKFSNDGSFKNIIGKKGVGPGEYEAPIDFCIERINKKIVLLDKGYFIKRYTTEGKYIDQHKLKEFSAIAVEKTMNGFAFIGGGRSDNLVIADSNFNKLTSSFPYRNKTLDRLIHSPIQRVNDSLTIYRRFFDKIIYKIENKRVEPHTFLSFRDKMKKSEHMNIDKDKIKNYPRIKYYFESKDFSYMAYFKKKEPFIVIFDKLKNRICNHFSYLKMKNDITLEKKSSYVIGVDQKSGKFIFYIEPANIINVLEKKSINSSVIVDKLKNIKTKISLHSNPVLMLANFKSFEK